MKRVIKSMLITAMLAGMAIAGTSETFGGLGISVFTGKNGVKVAGVIPNSPAESIGLQKGDLIVSVNGVELSGVEPQNQVSYLRGDAGSAISLTLERGDKKIALSTKRVELSVQNLDASDVSAWYSKSKGLTAEEISFLASQRVGEGYELLSVMQNGVPISASAENINANALQQVSAKKAQETILPEAKPIQNSTQEVILNGNAKEHSLVNVKGAKVAKQGNVPLYKNVKY